MEEYVGAGRVVVGLRLGGEVDVLGGESFLG